MVCLLYIMYFYLVTLLSKHSLSPPHSHGKATSVKKTLRLWDLNLIFSCLLVLDLVLCIVS